jgi:hypothetical protein
MIKFILAVIISLASFMALADPINVTPSNNPLDPLVYTAGEIDNMVGMTNHDLDEVGAMAMAASQVHFNTTSQRFQMGAGVGYFNGEQAVVLSGGMLVHERAPFLAISLTSTGEGNVNGGFGASWEF